MRDATNRRFDRRSMLKCLGAAGATSIAGCAGEEDNSDSGQGTTEQTQTPGQDQATTTAQSMTTMKHVVPEGSFYVVPFLYGVENDAWSQYGIDLKVEVGPFPKFQRQIVADQTNVGGMPMVSGLDFKLKGEDLTWIGPGMTFANYMLAKKDSGISSPEDIEGKRLGIPFESSTTTLGYRALMEDAFGMSLMDAPSSVRAAAPPVIYNLLEQDELDVIIEFSGFSIRGQIAEDIEVVFNPIEYWKENYGAVVPLTQRTTRTSWLEEDPANADLAIRWGKGWKKSLEIFRNNIDDAINRYGRLGGLTEEGMAEIVVDRMERGVQFSTPPYTEDQADANWQFSTALQSAGVFDSLPDRDEMITLSSDLEELANR